jgi:hypothetical protein
MNSSDSMQAQRLYQRLAPGWFYREVCQKHGYGMRREIYGADVVIWLMIWQRLHGNRSLAAAVQYLVQGQAGGLQIDCKRWTEEKVSAATGSYCQARQRLPRRIVGEVTERMVTGLRAEMQEGWKGLQRPVFVIDGSSLRLQHTRELVEAYSPGRNRHGENHWPGHRCSRKGLLILDKVGIVLRPWSADRRFPRRIQRIGFAAELGADVWRPTGE